MSHSERILWRRLHTIREKIRLILRQVAPDPDDDDNPVFHIELALAHIQTALETWPDQDDYRPMTGMDDGTLAKMKDDHVRRILLNTMTRVQLKGVPTPWELPAPDDEDI